MYWTWYIWPVCGCFPQFCTWGKANIDTPQLSKFIFANEEIHLNMQQGIVRIGEDGSLFCDKEIIVSVSNSIVEDKESVYAVLPNFTLKRVPKITKKIPTHSIHWLNKNSKNLKEGFNSYTIFQTPLFEAIKTSTMKIQTLNTLKRHITIGVEEDTSNIFSNFLLKRRLAEDSSSGNGSGERKRAKLNDAASVIS